MDFLRRSVRCSRLEKNRNNVIREKSILRIKKSYLKNFGMMSTGKKKRKTSKFGMQQVTTGMRERERERER